MLMSGTPPSVAMPTQLACPTAFSTNWHGPSRMACMAHQDKRSEGDSMMLPYKLWKAASACVCWLHVLFAEDSIAVPVIAVLRHLA